MTDKNLEYSNVEALVGNSLFIKDIKKIVLSIASNNVSVLLNGEHGTGKRSFAKIVHLQGKGDYFLEINCNVYNDDVLQKYFDLIKQFPASPAESKKTIYVSNIDNLSSNMQLVLCNLIKDMRSNKVNIRFIASTTKNLEELVEKGLFLRDLYFCISTVPVNMLPLRQRKEDILPIAEYYFSFFRMKTGRLFEGFSDACKEDMENAFWNGNVSELKNAVERGIIVGSNSFINSYDMAIKNTSEKNNAAVQIFEEFMQQNDLNENSDKSLKNAINTFKKNYVTKILEENNWNQTKTARILGIQRTYVIRLIDELQIRKNN